MATVGGVVKGLNWEDSKTFLLAGEAYTCDCGVPKTLLPWDSSAAECCAVFPKGLFCPNTDLLGEVKPNPPNVEGVDWPKTDGFWASDWPNTDGFWASDWPKTDGFWASDWPNTDGFWADSDDWPNPEKPWDGFDSSVDLGAPKVTWLLTLPKVASFLGAPKVTSFEGAPNVTLLLAFPKVTSVLGAPKVTLSPLGAPKVTLSFLGAPKVTWPKVAWLLALPKVAGAPKLIPLLLGAPKETEDDLVSGAV